MNSANNSESKDYQKNKFFRANNIMDNSTKYNLNQTQVQNKSNKNYNINHTESNETTNINNNRKNNQENLNKIKKENKSMFLSQIQLPIKSSVSPRNVNNIQNYIRLNQVKNNSKNNKKSPNNKSNQKLSTNNINLYHNKTENNINEKNSETTYNMEESYNTYKKTGRNSPKKSVYINRKSFSKNKNFEIDVDCPEELHFFYINIFQKGNKINFEKKK